jgi:hypothetical protein
VHHQSDNGLDVFMHNATADPTCDEMGELFYHRDAECTEYSALGKFSVNEDGPLFQTNTCIEAENNLPKPKAKSHKQTGMQKFWNSITHFFNNIF